MIWSRIGKMEKDWLCTDESLPTDDPEARMFASDIIGYLVGYAHLTNTPSPALVGDPEASPLRTPVLVLFVVCRERLVSGASPLKSGHGTRLHRKRFVVAHN
jgi:hypothetical protein